ncbi:MAG: cytochrome c oxidase subunit II [Betaproteobacteria bacterium]|jgi:cytochrome c oxidase subunit 2|nr:cytochrome c oxidase subunit II [Betaproteobacteria bacterium]
MMKKSLGAALAMLPLWAGAVLAAESKFNLQPPKSVIAQEIYSLHTIIMLICAVIFVGVFSVMFYSVFKHRKSLGYKAAHFHENTVVEVVWTIIPFLILMGMAYPATKTVIAMKDTSNPDLTIKATGYQWKWGYEYIKGDGDLAGVGDGIQLFSNLATPRDQIYDKNVVKSADYLLEVDTPLVVPVGKKVRILTTANDVIHAWWVPAFGVKQDAIPGFIRDTWFRADTTGTFRGQCAELCGKEHGFMPIVVKVVSVEEFKNWADQNKTKIAAAPAETLVDAAPAAPVQVAAAEPAKAGKVDGKKVYEGLCAACHATGAAGAPKTGDKAAWKPRVAQGADTLHQHAIKGIRAMPAKGGNPALSDAEVTAAVDHMVGQSK